MQDANECYICGFTVIECNTYLKELLVGKLRFKAKYDSSAEKPENV